MKPIRILYVNGGLMHRGGIESFMMNYYRHFDRSLVQIDFIVHGDGYGEYDEEIMALGGNIYHVPVKSKHPFRYAGEVKKVIKAGGYQIIHSHADAMSGWILKIAKECGVPVRIAHSHNTDHLTKNPIKRFLNDMAKKDIQKYATHLFACSNMAGAWLFGKKDFTVVNNAIDLCKFVYSNGVRTRIRKQFNIGANEFVIGHVGRFDRQKNHEFLIMVFAEYAKINPKAKLLLVGDGELRTEIEPLIATYDIQDRVLLTGVRSNVNEIYSAMDVFVLPSHFEGLPVVGLEAQANGLPCLFSSGVTKESQVTDNAQFLDLSVELWVAALKESEKATRLDGKSSLVEAGYDIEVESKKLQEFYLQISRGLSV